MATPAQVGDASFQALFARVTADPDWIRRVSDEITAAIHRELPELDGDDDLRSGTFTSTRSVLTLMADMVRVGRPGSEGRLPPDAVEYAREFVRRGLSIDALLRAYQVGNSTFFDNWVAGVHDRVEDPEALARAVELGANWTFDYVQALNRELVGQYSEERERWVRSAAALRTETVRSLLAGERVDSRRAAQRLRYELDRHHVAYVVWNDEDGTGPDDLPLLEHVAIELAEDAHAGQPLIVALGPRLICAWVGARRPLTMRLDGASHPALVAVGDPAAGVGGFCTSHREAMHARRVARLSGRPAGTVARYDDLALTAVASGDLALARAFVTAELGPLAGQSDEAVRLATTLRAYLEEHASPRRTARRLGVHENTVKNRVRTARSLLGRDPEDRVAEILVALRLAPVVDRAPDADRPPP